MATTATATATAAAATRGATTTTTTTTTSPTTSDTHLFDDTFIVTSINAGKYDRVSRIGGHNVAHDTDFTLDINHHMYPVGLNDTLHLVLAATLALDGSKEEEDNNNNKNSNDNNNSAPVPKGWRETQRGEATLADLFDYVCHGKIYRFEEGEGENMYVLFFLVFLFFSRESRARRGRGEGKKRG